MKPNIEKLAEIYQNQISANPPGGMKLRTWADMPTGHQTAAIAGMTAALDAYHESLGEGMPSVEDFWPQISDATLKSAGPTMDDCHKAGYEAFRNLMLSAFAKKTADLEAKVKHWEGEAVGWREACNKWQKECTKSDAKLSTIAVLPEKWCKTPCGSYFAGQIYRDQLDQCADELTTALTSPPALPPVPELTPELAAKGHEMTGHGPAIVIYDPSWVKTPVVEKPAPAVEADPYAHLKTAWASGKRIRIKKTSGEWSDWCDKSTSELHFVWAANRYEIEPEAPAEPWAKEKAAYRQHAKIEVRYLNADRTGWKEWQPCAGPIWATDGTLDYRIAPGSEPSPPAGKLTDEQLGEIGERAAGEWWKSGGKGTPQFTFAAAVAAEVRKECEAENAERWKLTAENAKHWEKESTKEELQAIYDANLPDLYARTMEENETLRAENAKQAEEIAALHERTHELNEEIAQQTKEYAALIMEHSKLQARLSSMEWRPISVNPTREDAGSDGWISVGFFGGKEWHESIAKIQGYPWLGSKDITHWRPLSPPPAPSPEDTSREEFEAWAKANRVGDCQRHTGGNYDGEYIGPNTEQAWKSWQAARKEGRHKNLANQARP